jgi:hypothetical protein
MWEIVFMSQSLTCLPGFQSFTPGGADREPGPGISPQSPPQLCGAGGREILAGKIRRPFFHHVINPTNCDGVSARLLSRRRESETETTRKNFLRSLRVKLDVFAICARIIACVTKPPRSVHKSDESAIYQTRR